VSIFLTFRMWLAPTLALVTACAAAPRPTDIVNADYGPVPTTYEIIAREYLSRHNPYPASMRFIEITPPRQIVWRRGGAAHAGYVTCVTYAGHIPAGDYMTVEAVIIRNDIAVDLFTGSAIRWYGTSVTLPGQTEPVCIRSDRQSRQ
jgi:hypothetical protein